MALLLKPSRGSLDTSHLLSIQKTLMFLEIPGVLGCARNQE